MRFGVSQFIADTERRTCAFCYKDVTSSEPFGILLINLLIDFSCPNLYTKFSCCSGVSISCQRLVLSCVII